MSCNFSHRFFVTVVIYVIFRVYVAKKIILTLTLVYLPRMQSVSVTMVSMVMHATWPVVMPTHANTTAHAWQRPMESSAAIVRPDITDDIVSSAVRPDVLGRTAYNAARVQKVKILFQGWVKICLCLKNTPWGKLVFIRIRGRADLFFGCP